MAFSINSNLHDQLEDLMVQYQESISLMKEAMDEKLAKFEEKGVGKVTDAMTKAFLKMHNTNTNLLIKNYDKEIDKLLEKGKTSKLDKFLKKFSKKYPDFSNYILTFIAAEFPDDSIPLAYHTGVITNRGLEYMAQMFEKLRKFNDELENARKSRR